MTTRPLVFPALLLGPLLAILGFSSLHAQQTPVLQLGESLTWRPIGPSEPGAVTAIAGDPSRLGVFFAGASGAGLWTSDDFGANWRPVFDAAPEGHITSIAAASSPPAVLYVTTSDSAHQPDAPGALHVTRDDGATWQRVAGFEGLRPDHVAIDPINTQHVVVTARATTPAQTGGVFRSTDGGNHFVRVLDRIGQRTPAFILNAADGTSRLLTLGQLPASAPGAFFVLDSRDGVTWRPATGIPAVDEDAWIDVTSTEGVAYLLVETRASRVLYRATPAADEWSVAGDLPPSAATEHARLALTADGTLLVSNGALFESRDHGATFSPTSPPSLRTPTRVWAHPSLAGIRMIGGPYGVGITVNGGTTWSDASALPAASVDRVSVDASFPYRVCAVVETSIQCSNDTTRQRGRVPWQRLPSGFTGSVVGDPLDSDVLIGGNGLRYNRVSGQVLGIQPADPPDHAVPMAFSPDGRTLFAGEGAIWRSTNGGQAWTAISPALASPSSRISALALSPIDPRVVWAGLDDGRVFVTRDGGAEWFERRHPAGADAIIRSIEPSRFDPQSAYVVAVPGNGGATSPTLARTRDSGTTWVDLGPRLGDRGRVHAIREDPLRRGLLFAGTDRSVVVSFDDGESWQSLALNLPATPVRDVVVKDADLVVATAGRGVWILDDLSPLRQLTADVARAELFLFRPAQAWRVRAGGEPAASDEASSSRAMLTYMLGRDAEEVTLEVIETATGDVIRRYSSRPGAPLTLAADPDAVPAVAGLHRVAWDLRYLAPVPGVAGAAPGTMVLPGTYQVRLTVDGRAVRQAITVRMDPRIRTSMVDLTAQRDLGRALDAARAAVEAARATTDATSASGRERATALATLAADLDRLARNLQQADVRPAARLESAIEHALTRVGVVIGGDTR